MICLQVVELDRHFSKTTANVGYDVKDAWSLEVQSATLNQNDSVNDASADNETGSGEDVPPSPHNDKWTSDDSHGAPLTNGVEDALTNGVEGPMTNGVEGPLTNGVEGMDSQDDSLKHDEAAEETHAINSRTSKFMFIASDKSCHIYIYIYNITRPLG